MKEKVKIILTAEVEKELKNEEYVEVTLDSGLKLKVLTKDIIRIYSSDLIGEGQNNPNFTC